MALKINTDYRYPYTIKEILEEEQTELWEKAQNVVNRLSEFQRKIVQLLPDSRKVLPTNSKELKDRNGQLALVDHIRLCTLYDFSQRVVNRIVNECIVLANCSKRDVLEEKDAQAALQSTLDSLCSYPLNDILTDTITGLLRFDRIKDIVKYNQNSVVFIKVYENYDYSDVIGIIENHGLNEELRVAAYENNDPKESSIKDLSEVLDDDTMLRVY